jgi:hypothetical protein
MEPSAAAETPESDMQADPPQPATAPDPSPTRTEPARCVRCTRSRASFEIKALGLHSCYHVQHIIYHSEPIHPWVTSRSSLQSALCMQAADGTTKSAARAVNEHP